MHRITFYPIGNADCCKVELEDGRLLLFDYAHTAKAEDDEDPRIDLEKTLRKELREAKRKDFDVVAFTHADDDHIRGLSDFFYLEHAKKYQDDDRIKIRELWVPAAIILEEGLPGEGRILRAEARHRLKEGKNIRIFSRPERLKDWIEDQGIEWEERKHLITDAGKLIPNFDGESNGVEFFVHSPFAVHIDEGLEDRNEAALIFHATFICEGKKTRFLLIGDTTHEILTDIVNITKYHNREERLEWDVYDIPHHCSYRALNQEKGKEKTEPVPNVKWLLDQGQDGGILVSSSDPIPSEDTTQPPHMQAAECYRESANSIGGEFKVTMEHPTVSDPKPIVITIDKDKARLKKLLASGSVSIINKPSPRAG
jgi:hypothetical protein